MQKNPGVMEMQFWIDDLPARWRVSICIVWRRLVGRMLINGWMRGWSPTNLSLTHPMMSETPDNNSTTTFGDATVFKHPRKVLVWH